MNNKNGIDGSANTRAGPANPKLNAPCNTPLAPIAFSPSARFVILSLKPPLALSPILSFAPVAASAALSVAPPKSPPTL